MACLVSVAHFVADARECMATLQIPSSHRGVRHSGMPHLRIAVLASVDIQMA